MTGADRLLVLTWHAIDVLPSVISMPPVAFRGQMEALAQRGLRGVSLAQAFEQREREGRFPRDAVVLTFDDGYISVMTEGLPVLAAHGFTATVFLASGLVGLTAAEARRRNPDIDRDLLGWPQGALGPRPVRRPIGPPVGRRPELDQFGHISDRTGVFDTVPWRETPDLIMDLIVDFKKPEGDGVHKVRFRDLARKRARSDVENLLPSRPAVPFTPGDVQFSVYLHANAVPGVLCCNRRSLDLARGLLDTREDIYYIYDKEIRAFAAGDNTGADFKDLVSQRKEDMARCEHAILPHHHG